MSIVETILEFGAPITLLIQKELQENGSKLFATSAGQHLDAELGEEIEKLSDRIKAMEREKEASAAEINELRAELRAANEARLRFRKYIVGAFPVLGFFFFFFFPTLLGR